MKTNVFYFSNTTFVKGLQAGNQTLRIPLCSVSGSRVGTSRPLPVPGEVFNDSGCRNIGGFLGQQQEDLLRMGLLLQQDSQEGVRPPTLWLCECLC